MRILLNLEEWQVQELIKCQQDFWYFLIYVRTLDSQGGRGSQPFPRWGYMKRLVTLLLENRQLLLLKSRQMAISWLLSAYALWKTMYIEGALTPVISKGGRESREIGNRVKYIYRMLPDFLKIPMKPNEQYGELNFPDMDSKIICLPSTPDIGRTFSAGGAIMDEMAFFPYASEVMASLAPIIDVKGWFVGVSTPNGRDGLFHPQWHDDDNKDMLRVKLHWSLRPDRGPEWAERMKKTVGMTPEKWNREYELSFATPAGKPVYTQFTARQIKDNVYKAWDKKKIILRGWDRGFHRPACVWTYINDQDQWCVAKELLGEDQQRDKFIAEVHEKSQAWFPEASFIDYVPSDFKNTESDGKDWIKVMKLYDMKPKIGRAGKDEIVRRTDAVRKRITLRDDGHYGMLVDGSCEILMEGFGGGYHYPERIGKPEEEKPHKDGYYDHLQDALAVIADNYFEKPKQSNDLTIHRPGKSKVNMAKKQMGTSRWR